jgi:hypothetical protein
LAMRRAAVSTSPPIELSDDGIGDTTAVLLA